MALLRVLTFLFSLMTGVVTARQEQVLRLTEDFELFGGNYNYFPSVASLFPVP